MGETTIGNGTGGSNISGSNGLKEMSGESLIAEGGIRAISATLL